MEQWVHCCKQLGHWDTLMEYSRSEWRWGEGGGKGPGGSQESYGLKGHSRSVV